MFDFLWFWKKKKKPAPVPKASVKPKPAQPAPGLPKADVPATPPGVKLAADVSEEPGYKIGEVMRVPGLGEFVVHDIKGGKGKSGMGIVYIVVDAHTTSPFAVKTFQKWCLGTPELVQRFLREAETWVRLEQHQNIVRAHYISTINAQPYVFLEYVAGSDLRRKLTSGALSIRDALRFSIQLSRGMAYAYKKVPGMVHRDLKPENCLFTPDDVLKVTDFGLVKVLAGADKIPISALSVVGDIPEDQAASSQFFQTREGEMGVGTLPYMAPEQFKDFANVTVQADIYSFGIMLYEMLTGKRPFRARSPEEWFSLHSTVLPRDPHLRREDVSLPLSKLTMRCMAKSPHERPKNFAVLEQELAKLYKDIFNEEYASVGSQELEAWEIMNKGAALNNLGKLAEALQCFEKALKIMPRLDSAWLNKGVVLSKTGKTKEAVDCYDKALEINPNSAPAWYNRAIAYQNENALENALISYERTLALNPLHDSAWLNKGVILRKLNRPQEALDCYDRVLVINAQSAVAWYNRGYAFRQLGRATDEMECYEKAIAIDPYYTEAWLNRGVALRKKNRLIEALGCYNKVLSMHPQHPAAWYNKGVVLRRMGSAAEARDAFEKASVLDVNLAAQIKAQGLL